VTESNDVENAAFLLYVWSNESSLG